MHQLEGILQVFTRELEAKTEKVKKMPPGDERAKCIVIIDDVKRLLAACDASVSDTPRANKLLYRVEEEIDRL